MNPKFQVNFFTLIHDQEFVKWVNNPDPESDLHWNKFLLEHPECRKDWEDAVYIIKQLNRDGINFDEKAAGNLWKSIREKTITQKRQIPIFRLLAAASILLVLGIGGVLIYQWKYSGESLIDYKSLAKVETTDNEVKLILSDQSEEVLNATEPEVKYNRNGEIEVNSQKRLEQKLESQKAGNEMLNQLVVPRGRRSNLVLSDGTRLWLNSGSRAVFPVVFTKKTREIYIEGEAYLDVAHDPSKPFYVVTDKIRVEVMGTKFNVSAYPDDISTSVVLVEGSVQAIVGTKKLTMKPDHLLKYENSTGKTSLQIADVLMYTSWKDGWLNCYKESLETIATKLSRYYDRQIEFKDPQAKELTLTGKLDLKTECAEVFTAICSTAPISFEEKDNIFLISLTTLN